MLNKNEPEKASKLFMGQFSIRFILVAAQPPPKVNKNKSKL